MCLTQFQRPPLGLKTSPLKSFFTAAALTVFLGAPAHAFIGDVAIVIDPSAPTAGSEILVQVSGISTPTAEVEAVEVDGNVVTIQIDDTCLGLCPAEDFSFDVVIDALDPGDYELKITDIFGTSVATTPLQVTEAAFSGLFIRSHIDASSLSDNDHMRVLVTAHTCLSMELVSTSVVDRRVEIRGHIEDGVCAQVRAFTSAFSADVGPLEAGEYEVVVLLQDESDPDAGFQQAAFDRVQIGDAPDLAALRDERFEVRVDWKDHAGDTGAGRPVPGASDSTTLFSFFGRDNWELMVKVLDGCALNDHYWVFAAASTDVEYTLEVTDTVTGQIRTYSNDLGQRAPATTDVLAFATCSE